MGHTFEQIALFNKRFRLLAQPSEVIGKKEACEYTTSLVLCCPLSFRQLGGRLAVKFQASARPVEFRCSAYLELRLRERLPIAAFAL